MADARAAFLQLVADSQTRCLPDNLDPLFHPYGHELPDPDGAGVRLVEQLAILERAAVLWRQLGDEASRELWLRFLAYRALGPAHVRLQLDPLEYRRSVVALTAQAMRQPAALATPGMPFEWGLHHYDLRAVGIPIEVIGPPLPLASTYVFSQYAYRDEAVVARAAPGRRGRRRRRLLGRHGAVAGPRRRRAGPRAHVRARSAQPIAARGQPAPEPGARAPRARAPLPARAHGPARRCGSTT